MYKKYFLSLLACAIIPFVTLQAEEESNPQNEVVSRAFGHMLGKNLIENPGYQFSLDDVIKGIKEEMAGEPSPLSDEEFDELTAQISQKCLDEMSETNLKQANAFLEKNADNEDIKEIVPGKLQMSVLKQGEGPTITENNTPLIHYTGRYLNDTVFGTSEQMEPIALELNETIPGFKQGLIGAKEGESRRLYIHPELGYGTSGFLLPNALMIFDIEVVKAQVEQTDSPSS